MRRSLPADESESDRDTPRSSGSTTLSAHEAAERAQVASVLTGTALLLSATLVGVILVYFQTVLVPMTLAVALNYLIEPVVQLIMRLIGCGGRLCRCCRSRRGGSSGTGSPGTRGSAAPPPSPVPRDASINRADSAEQPGAEQREGELAAPLLLQRQSTMLPPTVSTVTAEETGLPRGLVRAVSVLVAIAIVVLCVGAVAMLVTAEIQSLVANLQRYTAEAQRLEHTANELLLKEFSINITQAGTYVRQAVENEAFVGGLAAFVANFVTATIITLVLTVFMLFSSELAHSPQPNVPAPDELILPRGAPDPLELRTLRPQRNELKQAVAAHVSRYIRLKTCVCLGLAVCMSVFLFVIGVEVPLCFGVITFIVNYVPNFGCIVAYLAPLPVVFLDPRIGASAELWACIVPFSIHMFTGQVIEPKLYSASLDLHPVTILLSLCAWGVLWGVVGVIVAVPITATAKIWMSHRGEDPLQLWCWLVGLLEGRVFG